MILKRLLIYILIASSMCFAQIETTVYWHAPISGTNTGLLGLNICKGTEPQTAINEKYQDNLRYIGPVIIQLNVFSSNSTPQSSWINEKQQTWDTENIQQVFKAFTSDNPDTLIINMNQFPAWMLDDNHELLSSQFERYANWCAQLVKIINIDQNWNVKYWSPLNIQNSEAFTSSLQYAELFNLCAKAMKTVDPSILIGGGGFDRDKGRKDIKTFLRETDRNLDFLTLSFSVTDNISSSDNDIFNGAHAMADYSTRIRTTMDSLGLATTPLWISKYNISNNKDFELYREFQNSSKGAVFNALSLKYLSEQGSVQNSLVWNDCDQSYGIMDDSFYLRPSAMLLYLKNKYLEGTPVKSVSKRSSLVNIFAIDAGYSKNVLLMNLTDQDQTVNLDFQNWQPSNSSYLCYTINKDDLYVDRKIYSDNLDGLKLGPYELLLLNFTTFSTSVFNKSDEQEIPENYNLSQPYPNPFNASSIIQFSVDNPQSVRITLYNASGQLINELFYGMVNGKQTYTLQVDGSDLASGQYRVFLEGEEFTASRSLLHIK